MGSASHLRRTLNVDDESLVDSRERLPRFGFERKAWLCRSEREEIGPLCRIIDRYSLWPRYPPRRSNPPRSFDALILADPRP
jgi:hypothetical protein